MDYFLEDSRGKSNSAPAYRQCPACGGGVRHGGRPPGVRFGPAGQSLRIEGVAKVLVGEGGFAEALLTLVLYLHHPFDVIVLRGAARQIASPPAGEDLLLGPKDPAAVDLLVDHLVLCECFGRCPAERCLNLAVGASGGEHRGREEGSEGVYRVLLGAYRVRDALLARLVVGADRDRKKAVEDIVAHALREWAADALRAAEERGVVAPRWRHPCFELPARERPGRVDRGRGVVGQPDRAVAPLFGERVTLAGWGADDRVVSLRDVEELFGGGGVCLHAVLEVPGEVEEEYVHPAPVLVAERNLGLPEAGLGEGVEQGAAGGAELRVPRPALGGSPYATAGVVGGRCPPTWPGAAVGHVRALLDVEHARDQLVAQGSLLPWGEVLWADVLGVSPGHLVHTSRGEGE
eukprot:scaffold4268_cov56-Phaeocystis_antarctica.AAC.5